ncbi:MAG: Ig domain-containing protein [Gemmatimonadales bacterium]|nr:Ig domain-containing protein [Gemmatimonadales bacterium]MBP6571517.1 Ig domain-containing protein [Gemmatimonadales bacterium]MBP7620269.1 Ig domain-containing protein [Gemmatimonadales bacterium]MBP9899039.1 Ig domain-containing protein [Gemmatimonadales bacterium]
MRRLAFAAAVVLLAACSSTPSGPQSPPATVPVASVAVTPATATIVEGGTATLAATPRNADGATLTGRTITWSSGNESIATVSSSGMVTAVVAGGPVTITATSEGKSGTATVTISQTPVATVAMSSVTLSMQVGQTSTLIATPRAAGGGALTGRPVTWLSANPSIASVSGTGLVTAVGAGGPVAITATSEGQVGTTQVTVTAAPAALWTVSNELRQGSIDPAIGMWGMAIAPNGAALSYQGTSIFERSTSGTWNPVGVTMAGSPAVVSVHADPNSGLWATGSNGVILRKVGPTWTAEATGTNAAAFNALSIRADGSGFAVGNPGNTIYARSTTGVWSTMASPTSMILTQVGSPTANFALALGIATNNGVGLVWNGGAWSVTPFPVANFKPDQLIVVSPTEAYALGQTGTDPLVNMRYTILEWTGAAWQVLLQRPVEFYPYTSGAARCPNGTIYFGSRYGTIYRKQGAALTTINTNGEFASTGFSLACDTDNSLVMYNGLDALVARYNGAWAIERWRPNLSYVSMGSATSIFATSESAVARFNGATWTRTPIPLGNGAPVVIPPAIWASGNQAVVGGGPAGVFNGTSWQWSAPSPSRGAKAVWGTSPSQVFSVGGFGNIDLWNGSSWSSVAFPSGGPITLDQLDGNGNFALAVYSTGTPALQWNGTVWSTFTQTPPTGWGAVRVLSATSIVNVRFDAVSLWNGTAWTTLPGGGPSSSTDVHLIRSPTDIYLFNSGEIKHYNGTAWSVVGTYTGTIRDVAIFGNQAVAVGADGLVMRATLP